jgi:hypothetical protein
VRAAAEFDWRHANIGLAEYANGLATIGTNATRAATSMNSLHQPITEMGTMLVSFSDDFAKLFVGAFTEADKDLGAAMASMLKRIAEFLLQLLVFKPLFQAASSFLTASFGGGGVGTSPGGGLSGTTAMAPSGGARAAGGPVAAGTAYTVGEMGPEIFVPSQNGTILPNGSGGDVTVIVNAPPGSSVSRQEERRNPFGGREVEVWIEAAVNKGISSGRFDNAMAQSYGASRMGRV